VLVVVVDVLDEQRHELAFVPDDGAVDQFVAQGWDPPFGVRVGLRRSWWCADSGDPRSGEDVIE